MDSPMRSDPIVPFLNPDLIAHLVDWSNEAPIIANGQKVTALIDSGAQVSSVSSAFCEQMALKVHHVDWLLVLEGTGGSAIPYLVYVEFNLQIPGIKGYNEDILLLVIPTMTYSEKVPVVVGSKIIDRLMGRIMKGELVNSATTWKQAHFNAFMSGPLQLSHRGTKGMGMLQRGPIPPPPSTLPCLRSSLWTMSRGMSAPHKGSPFLHLGPSIYMATPMSEGTVCESTCLPCQYVAPSCPPPWSLL